MPKLTGEELAELYPKAKTYDEVQAEREAYLKKRRPKFVPAKIALYTSLCVPIAAASYSLALRVVHTVISTATPGNSGASMIALAGVCFVIFVSVVGLAAIYYLWHLADSMASKIIVGTRLLYTVLSAILFVAGLILFGTGQFDNVLTACLLAVGVFLAAYATVYVLLKRELAA